MHLFVHDPIVLDERADGVVLCLVGTALVGTLVRRHSRQLLGQLGLVVALGKVPPKVRLGLA